MVRAPRTILLLAVALIARTVAGYAADVSLETSENAAGIDTISPAAARLEEGTTWHSDYRDAVVLATRLKRPLLLNFTGSDWCYWCRLLKSEVFDTTGFLAWAEKTVVLLEVDFPRTVPQDARLRRQNADLARRFSDFVEGGYPTILFLDSSGTRILGDLGYLEGGPNAWTEEADRILTRAH